MQEEKTNFFPLSYVFPNTIFLIHKKNKIKSELYLACKTFVILDRFNFFSLIETTLWTNPMWGFQSMTLWTFNQIRSG